MRPTVARRTPKSPTKAAAYARSIVTAMTDNPFFPSPVPPLAEVLAGIEALMAAEAALLTRTRGLRAIRDERFARVRRDVARLGWHVQEVADADPEHAAAIIASAGFGLANPPIPKKVPFKVEKGRAPGSAKLTRKSAGDRASYDWRWSTDERTWHDARPTLQCKTVIFGLPPMTRVFFQVRVTTKDGPGDWSDSVSFMVE